MISPGDLDALLVFRLELECLRLDYQVLGRAVHPYRKVQAMAPQWLGPPLLLDPIVVERDAAVGTLAPGSLNLGEELFLP